MRILIVTDTYYPGRLACAVRMRVIVETLADESPQFGAVIKGDISLIESRLERRMSCDQFEQYTHSFFQCTMVKSGITGYAKVYGGYDLLPERQVIYDLEYKKSKYKHGFENHLGNHSLSHIARWRKVICCGCPVL